MPPSIVLPDPPEQGTTECPQPATPSARQRSQDSPPPRNPPDQAKRAPPDQSPAAIRSPRSPGSDYIAPRAPLPRTRQLPRVESPVLRNRRDPITPWLPCESVVPPDVPKARMA